jgi:hypothetical protein
MLVGIYQFAKSTGHTPNSVDLFVKTAAELARIDNDQPLYRRLAQALKQALESDPSGSIELPSARWPLWGLLRCAACNAFGQD